MKRILLTGGAGFIAHHAILHILKNTDWEIVSLDRLDYSGNLNRIADIMSDLDSKTKKRLYEFCIIFKKCFTMQILSY
mgnify:CR=1 FL=1